MAAVSLHGPNYTVAVRAILRSLPLPTSSREDNDLVGIHVSDVKPSLGRVKALVIEADCWARHGHIRDLLERDLFSEAAFERRAASRPIEKINNVSAKTLLTLRVRITCLQRMFSEYVLWEERSV